MMTMALLRFAILAFGVLFFAGGGIAEAVSAECEPITFAQGTTALTLEGNAPAEGVACFSFEAEAGQSVLVNVTSASEVLFSIEGVTDGQNDYSFVAAESRPYQIVVFQLTRAVQAKPFTLTVTRAGVAPTQAWSVIPDRDNSRVQTSVLATDGATQLLGGCGTGVRGFTFSMTYAGDRLRRVDDGREPVKVSFDFPNRASITHEIEMYYFEPDLAHVVVGGLTGNFLTDLAEGSAMHLANALGEKIVTVPLSGTARLRATMREVCGI